MFMYTTGSKTTLEVLLMTSAERDGRDFDSSKTLAGQCRQGEELIAEIIARTKS
jgi:hypothetical protein